MTINNVNLKYLEHYYLPRVVNQYESQGREKDPVSDAANTAIISGISATVTNIFQFVIPQGLPKITNIGLPSFAFLTQNLTLGIFSIILGVFALGRFKQSMALAEDSCEANRKVLESTSHWNALLEEGIVEDIVEVAQLQSSIDANNLQFIKVNLVCFTFAIGLIAANAIFSSLSLEILAMATICAMITTLIVFSYNLGSHWDDNIIQKKRIEALRVGGIITKLHEINYPQGSEKTCKPSEYTLSLLGLNGGLPVSPINPASQILICQPAS